MENGKLIDWKRRLQNVKKLKNLLTNNIGLKFLSVLFAMILWLVVVNIDDPDKTSTFTTNITIANENAIADMGKKLFHYQ